MKVTLTLFNVSSFERKKKFRRSSVCLPTAVSLKLVLLHSAGQELDTHFLVRAHNKEAGEWAESAL